MYRVMLSAILPVFTYTEDLARELVSGCCKILRLVEWCHMLNLHPRFLRHSSPSRHSSTIEAESNNSLLHPSSRLLPQTASDLNGSLKWCNVYIDTPTRRCTKKATPKRSPPLPPAPASTVQHFWSRFAHRKMRSNDNEDFHDIYGLE